MRRLRPRPTETLLRYSPRRAVPTFSALLARTKCGALKERILRRSSGTRQRVTRFTNTEQTTAEAAGSDEESRHIGECDSDGERNGLAPKGIPW